MRSLKSRTRKSRARGIIDRTAIITAIIVALSTIVVALINIMPRILPPPSTQPPAAATPAPTALTIVIDRSPTSTPPSTPPPVGAIHGQLTTQSGKPVPDIKVSIDNGPSVTTDIKGMFVMDKVPAGNRVLIVEVSGGRLRQNVVVAPDQDTQANVLVDTANSRLATLTIGAPLDNTPYQVKASQPLTPG